MHLMIWYFVLFDLHSIALQATQSEQHASTVDYSLIWVAVGSLAAALGIFISSIFSFFSERRERNSTLLDSLQSFSAKLADLTAKEGSLKTRADCESYAWNYLDIVDSIAYLYDKKVIPSDAIDYFDNNFLYALLLREWLFENKIRGELPVKDETWSDLIDFCSQHDMAKFNSNNHVTHWILPSGDVEMHYDKEKEKLPYAMQDYEHLARDERTVLK